MAKICTSISVVATATFCLCFCSFAFAGQATVSTYKDGNSKNQLNIYQGDQFILDFSLKWFQRGEEFKDVELLNLTQSVTGIPEDVNIVLTRAVNSLYTVTSVSPVTFKYGRSATVLSSSAMYPRQYATEFYVQNSANATIPLRNLRQLSLTSHALATNPGILVRIVPYRN